MKINPLEWSEVREKFEVPSGVLQLRSIAPFGLLIVTQGVEAAIGLQTQARVTLTEASTVFLTPAEGAKVYRKDTVSRSVRMKGEKFTNIDRLPMESEHMAEVTKAMRLMKLEERAMIRRIREERELSEAVIETSKTRRKDQEKAEAEAEAAAAAAALAAAPAPQASA